jgi:hypothetical protein
MDTPVGITALHTESSASRDLAYALGRELQSLAAAQASLDHDFCALVDDFDATDAIRYFHGMKSSAHYLAWACAMNGTVAREHVRVARALRDMPQTKDLFRQGRFSYSKVREITRLVGEVDESELCRLALEMTASQLARTVPTFRLLAGSRIRALPERSYSARPTGGGMVRISVVLPAEQAALVGAAIEAATRVVPEPPPVEVVDDDDETQRRRRPPEVRPPDRVQALVDIAATYLDILPGEPADDHTVVMVHVSAESLDVPAGTPRTDDRLVPAGTSLASGTCHVEGHGPIEPATAERLLCTAKVQGILTGSAGKVLHLGRSRRLATRAQRRALKVRDTGICQFPGCASTTHLDAHHIQPWSHGGPTDLDNLILICGRHHSLVHEGGLLIVAAPDTAARRWDFHLPDGRRIDPDGYIGWRHADSIEVILESLSAEHDDDPTRIFPRHAGAGFSLDECVRVLFDITVEQPVPAAA